jgi:hypothetical protein
MAKTAYEHILSNEVASHSTYSKRSVVRLTFHGKFREGAMLVQAKLRPQLYSHSFLKPLLSLFHGSLIYDPEGLIKWKDGTSGKYNSTISFYGSSLVLLFIEYKDRFPGSNAHTEIVAQVIAEMDAADVFNDTQGDIRIPIHAILTDGQGFEFYYCDSSWIVRRGMTNENEGMIPREQRIHLDEGCPSYLSNLKIVVEVIFDTLLQAYVNAIHESRVAWEKKRESLARAPDYSRMAERIVVRTEKAKEALQTLRGARKLEDLKDAEEHAKLGLQLLRESVLAIPYKDRSLMDRWEDQMEDLLRA